jgi:hypothetical protein
MKIYLAFSWHVNDLMMHKVRLHYLVILPHVVVAAASGESESLSLSRPLSLSLS